MKLVDINRPVLKIHFSVEDLARTRVLAGYGPYAEALFSIGALRRRNRDSWLFDGWRRQVRQAGGKWPGMLGPVVGDPPILDLFTLMGRVSSSEEGTAVLLSAPRRALRVEIEQTAAYLHALAAERRGPVSTLPNWALRIADDRAVRSAFVTALGDCCRAAVDPSWHRIRGYLESEASAQMQILGKGGLGLVLDGLHPQLRWRDGTLEVLNWSGRPGEIHLGGRGVVLAPSVFCRTVRVFCGTINPGEPYVLFYPAVRDVTEALRLWSPAGNRSTGEALASLLGSTRANALDIIGSGCTTTELARRLGVSAATASHHATVLRRAGLIATHRRRHAVLHTISPLGRAILNGGLDRTHAPKPGPRT